MTGQFHIRANSRKKMPTKREKRRRYKRDRTHSKNALISDYTASDCSVSSEISVVETSQFTDLGRGSKSSTSSFIQVPKSHVNSSESNIIPNLTRNSNRSSSSVNEVPNSNDHSKFSNVISFFFFSKEFY